MDARFVREGVPADDRLVGLNRLTGYLRQQLLASNSLGLDPVSYGRRSWRTRSAITVLRATRCRRAADTVHRALDLAHAALDGRGCSPPRGPGRCGSGR